MQGAALEGTASRRQQSTPLPLAGSRALQETPEAEAEARALKEGPEAEAREEPAGGAVAVAEGREAGRRLSLMEHELEAADDTLLMTSASHRPLTAVPAPS